MMSTQKDIAKIAGVSTFTVSQVINKKGFVSKELAKRVNDAIKELNYTPNLIARSLKVRKSKIIGFIFPSTDNIFFLEFIKKAEDYAFKNGYNIILSNSNNDPEKEKKHIEVLKGKLIDGFIIISSIRDI